MTDQDPVVQDTVNQDPGDQDPGDQDPGDQDPVDQDPGAGDGPVRYEERGRIAVITLDRPQYRNAQNSAMTYALDAALTRAVNDPGIAVIVLAGSR